MPKARSQAAPPRKKKRVYVSEEEREEDEDYMPVIVVDDDSSDSDVEYDEQASIRNAALKQKIKDSERQLKRRIAQEKATEKEQEIVEEEELRTSYKPGQLHSLLSLPAEVIERCFNVDYGILQLGDYVALSQTCKAFRNGFDEDSWMSIYMRVGPGKKGVVTDNHSLYADCSSKESTLFVSGQPITFPRALYGQARADEIISKGKGFSSRVLKLGRDSDPENTQLERLGRLVEEWNGLIPMRVDKPHHRGPVAHLLIVTNAAQHERLKADDEKFAQEYAKKLSEYNRFLESCSRFQLQRLPLSREELYCNGKSEEKLPIKARYREIGVFEVMCLRSYNFPLKSLEELTLRTFLPAAEIKANLTPVRGHLIEKNPKKPDPSPSECYFFAKDADRFMIKRASLIKAKEARFRAEKKAEKLKEDLEYAKREQEQKRQQQNRKRRRVEVWCDDCEEVHSESEGGCAWAW